MPFLIHMYGGSSTEWNPLSTPTGLDAGRSIYTPQSTSTSGNLLLQLLNTFGLWHNFI